MIGTRLGQRYEITGELGRGGMGVVYRARDPLLNREVAVKLVSPGFLTPQAEERFQREAQMVAQMDHPAIVPIYDIGQHEGSMFFLMPVVRGENLRVFLRAQQRRLGDIIDIAIQAAEGLEYSHARGVIHRDIKPENIMVSEEEGGFRVRIMDFGLAKAASDQRLTRTGTLVGTVAYFSPEQVLSKEVDHRSDLYSLGTVLYEAIAGEPPFTGEMQSILYRIVHENPRSLRALGAEISQELEGVILSTLAKEPARRCQSAGELVDAMRRYRSTLRDSDLGRSIVLSTVMTMQHRAAAAAPFIGREPEVAELQRRLNAAVSGDCQFVVLAGEPGIGKTRIVEEIENLARARRITVLHGRFMEQDRTFAYQGFCEAIQEYFRSGESRDSRDFSDLANDLVTLFPVLAEISEIRPSRNSDPAAVGAESRKADDRTWVLELLARTFARIGAGRPLMLVFENLHSAELSLDALQYVVRRLGPTPTLIVGTYRQTEIDKRHPLVKALDGFAADPRFHSMTLGPLSPSEHRRFIETMLGGEQRLAEGLADRLYEATEANPFFTRELVRSLVDSGGIALSDNGAWTPSGEMAISSDSLPATIQQTVEKRIQRLPEELRELLSLAAVAGRSFEFRDLETLAERDIDEIVERLIYEGLIEEERESRGDRLAFSSGIVRDVLYTALSRRKRKSIHRKFAELLEKRHSGRLERVYPQLVHHFSEGDVPDKTVTYGMIVARRSLDAFSPEEAAQTLRSVLEFLEDDEWNPEPGTDGEARMLLAIALRQQGQIEGALREAEEAGKIFTREKQTGRAVAASLLAAETAFQGRRVEETRRWLELGIAAARAADEKECLANLLSLAATVANLRGEYAKAKELVEEMERLRPAEVRSAEDPSIRPGGRLKVALGNPAPARQPAEIALVEESEILSLAFERLVATDERGHLVSLLCESWEMREDGRALDLLLRENVEFHDGAPLDARAVKSSIENSVRLHRRETAAYSTIEGFEELRAGTSDEISGITVLSDRSLEIRLRDPLPIYPALLTDPGTGIARTELTSEGKERISGTGPFRISQHEAGRIVMEKNPGYWRPGRPHLDAIDFQVFPNAAAIASSLRAGEVDLGHDLLPQDLEELLRDPRFRAGLQEAAKKITYFLVFNHSSPAGGDERVRRALCGVVPVHDLVWRSLGRLAQPATTLIPPGILGHDAGRRRHPISRDQGVELLAQSGVSRPLVLRAAVHPLYRDRYRALTDALFEIWAGLGVEVEVATPTLESFMKSYADDPTIDLRIMRWAADYDDADNFVHGLLHSGNGVISRYLSSPQLDQLAEEGRSERSPAAREAIYRRFENVIADAGSILPLFHEIDYRLASPFVKGLQLRSTPPFVNYAELGKTEAISQSAAVRGAGGTIVIPMAGEVESLDPTWAETVETAEVIPSVFESLLRLGGGARVVPGLAEEVLSEDGGKRYRIRLRKDVRFHDGRRFTARDVRFSFERLLTRSVGNRWLFSSIRGASALIEGTATELAGLQIVSPLEIVIELERPLSFFPTLLSHLSASIVPEGTGEITSPWRERSIGTGPFRVVDFEPGKRLELERNPLYWRTGYPKSDALVFQFGVSSERIREEFQAGRLSIANDLRPADVEALRHDPMFAGGYREMPRLSVYFAAFNRHRGPLQDPEVRRRLLREVDVRAIVQRHLGRLAIPAHGIIPPGLLGHTPAAAAGSVSSPPNERKGEPLHLTAAVHPIFFGQYAAIGKGLIDAFSSRNIHIQVVHQTMPAYMESRLALKEDLLIGRWFGDYPDADTFVHGMLNTQGGNIGRYCGSPELDHLIESGRVESDPAIRHAIYHEVEQILTRDALLLPLFHEQIYRVARPEVEGLSLSLGFPEVAYDELRFRQ